MVSRKDGVSELSTIMAFAWAACFRGGLSTPDPSGGSGDGKT